MPAKVKKRQTLRRRPDTAARQSGLLWPGAAWRRAGSRTLGQPSADDFRRLLAFRVALRRFQHWSETRAQLAGLTHVQHQLLVAVKGHQGDRPPAVTDLAGYLLLRHNSAVELIDRAVSAGLVQRGADPDDARVTRVALTSLGDELVTRLTEATLTELRDLVVTLTNLSEAHEKLGS